MREFSRSVAGTYSGAGIKEFVHVLKEVLAYQFSENEYVQKGFDINDTLLVIFWNGNDFLDDHMATKCDPKVAELLRELSELLNHFLIIVLLLHAVPMCGEPRPNLSTFSARTSQH